MKRDHGNVDFIGVSTRLAPSGMQSARSCHPELVPPWMLCVTHTALPPTNVTGINQLDSDRDQFPKCFPTLSWAAIAELRVCIVTNSLWKAQIQGSTQRPH